MTVSNEPAELRRQRILSFANENDFLRPADLAIELGVSGETIRRDLQALEKSGQIRRLHGGVVLEKELRAVEPNRESRAKTNLKGKKEIAEIAASLLGNDDAVFLDVGTTIETAAQAIPKNFSGTLITSSLIIGSLLGNLEHVNLQILGGKLRAGEYTTFGPDTIAQIDNYNADFAFISAGGIHPENGITDYSTDDVASRLAMIKRSKSAFVLATSDKLGKTALRHVCDVKEIQGVITDSNVSDTQIAQFRNAGIELLHP
ncbi:MAG: DeoR/GlpR family DNA-binding transcription regulator [Aurantimicrobium sp.]